VKRFADANLIRQIRGLQADADAILELLFLSFRIETQHRNLPATTRAQAFQDFHCSSLACAIRSEQAKDFTSLDFEIEATHGLDRTVRFAQLPHGNGWSTAHRGMYRLFEEVLHRQSQQHFGRHALVTSCSRRNAAYALEEEHI
jgi:hypothetical protein